MPNASEFLAKQQFITSKEVHFALQEWHARQPLNLYIYIGCKRGDYTTQNFLFLVFTHKPPLVYEE